VIILLYDSGKASFIYYYHTYMQARKEAVYAAGFGSGGKNSLFV